MPLATATPADAMPTTDRLRIDFLFLDLTTCTRCRGTDQSFESALDVMREVLTATGVEVEVNKIHVESAAQARELRFVSSPTIRVNGRDIALEPRESPCGCDACSDLCGDEIACRDWVYDGREYTEAPVAMIVDAVLRAVYGGMTVALEADAEAYELPENLARFFAGKAAAQNPEAPEQAACCSSTEERSCCEPGDKDECCASTMEGCGCR